MKKRVIISIVIFLIVVIGFFVGGYILFKESTSTPSYARFTIKGCDYTLSQGVPTSEALTEDRIKGMAYEGLCMNDNYTIGTATKNEDKIWEIGFSCKDETLFCGGRVLIDEKKHTIDVEYVQ